MATNFILIDRDTRYILPPCVQDYLPDNHLARFVVEIVDQLDLSYLTTRYQGKGKRPYHPAMLLSLLFYGYTTGTFSSRRLEDSTYDSMAFKFIAANKHPDHDTINTFRKRFKKEIKGLFVEILILAEAMGLLKLGTVNLDGTKIKAEAHNVIRLGQRPRYTWQQAVVRWLTESEKKPLETDKYHFKWLRPLLDDVYLEAIDPELIDKIITAKLKVAGKTRVNRTTELIRAVLNKVQKEWDWIESVPYIRQFKEKSQRLRWLTHSEANRLLKELPEHTKAMAIFTLATGLRESNVTGLEWSQVNLQSKIAWIHADQSKTGKTIRIPLNENAITVLTEQLGKHPVRVFTFRGNPVTKVGTKWWRMALERAGVDNFTWHGLRHTWASWHVQNGTPLNVLQELGGWSSYDMVLRYAHLAPDHLSEFASNINLEIVAKSVAPDNVVKLKSR